MQRLKLPRSSGESMETAAFDTGLFLHLTISPSFE